MFLLLLPDLHEIPGRLWSKRNPRLLLTFETSLRTHLGGHDSTGRLPDDGTGPSWGGVLHPWSGLTICTCFMCYSPPPTKDLSDSIIAYPNTKVRFLNLRLRLLVLGILRRRRSRYWTTSLSSRRVLVRDRGTESLVVQDIWTLGERRNVWPVAGSVFRPC